MKYNSNNQLDYFEYFDRSPYDNNYYIEHHIIDGKICDIKVKYPIIT